MLVLSLIYSIKFYRTVRESLCPYLEDESRYRSDFYITRYNILYPVIDAYWRFYDEQTIEEDFGIPKNALEERLIDQSNAADPGNKIVETINTLLEESATDFYKEGSVPPNPALMDCIQGEVLKYWLEGRLTKHLMGHYKHMALDSRVTFNDMEAKMTEYKSSLAGTTDNSVRFNTVIEGNTLYNSLIPSDIDALTDALGGGFGRGEVAIIGGVNGGGKTVMACQMASHMAKLGHNVLFFTTEETPPALVARIVSNGTNTSIGEFKKRQDVPPGSVNYLISNIPPWMWNDPIKSERIKTLLNDIDNRICFINWAEHQGYSIESHFDLEIENQVAKGFNPGVILFDWVGGALAQGKHLDKLRHAYQAGVEHIVGSMKKSGRTAIILAQLDKTAIKGQKQIKMHMLSECKTMTNKVTAFIGISALTESVVEGCEGTSKNLATRQYLNVEKMRSGKGGSVPVDIFFEFQRFKEISRRVQGGSQ